MELLPAAISPTPGRLFPSSPVSGPTPRHSVGRACTASFAACLVATRQQRSRRTARKADAETVKRQLLLRCGNRFAKEAEREEAWCPTETETKDVLL